MELRLTFLLILISPLFCNAQPNAEELVSSSLNAIGGAELWQNMESRVSSEIYVVYSSNTMIETIDREMEWTNVFSAPNNYLEFWTEDYYWNSLCFTERTCWAYNGQDNSVMFLDDDLGKKVDRFPYTRLIEIFNFAVIGAVKEEENAYVINFHEERWNRKLSVYFDKETYLIKKHSYSDDGVNLNEYFYRNYKEQNNFTEPYLVERFLNGKRTQKIIVNDIVYNKEINSKLFKSPASNNGRNVAVLPKPLPFPKVFME